MKHQIASGICFSSRCDNIMAGPSSSSQDENDPRFRQLLDLAASDDSDISGPAKADIYREFGVLENAG
jgi:hypothetical protein